MNLRKRWQSSPSLGDKAKLNSTGKQLKDIFDFAWKTSFSRKEPIISSEKLLAKSNGRRKLITFDIHLRKKFQLFLKAIAHHELKPIQKFLDTPE